MPLGGAVEFIREWIENDAEDGHGAERQADGDATRWEACRFERNGVSVEGQCWRGRKKRSRARDAPWTKLVVPCDAVDRQRAKVSLPACELQRARRRPTSIGSTIQVGSSPSILSALAAADSSPMNAWVG